ncbi:MAG: 3-oxoacyl-[acyl-carrier-protein] reductase [Rhodospirillaceae bacterium]|nr:3-oxoacyl-[acyl-carrier-protein] reductase [Rhodospirillaceae bacterium]
MFDLTGRNALVTGASGAIGGAIAKALHAQGAAVALSGTRRAALDALAGELGERVHVAPANLGDAKETEALPGRVEEALGDLHILVNNAGLTRDMLALRLSDDQWQSVLDVNLTATFRLSRAALRGMMRRRHGRIINIASIVGVTGNPGQANYAASKAGMIGMTKSMAAEVAARGVTLNCIAPGFVRSPMTDALSEQQQTGLLERIPAGRIGEPGDIAGAAVWLASDEAAWVTGQTVHVNGGMVMV